MNQVYCCISFRSKLNQFHIMLIFIKICEILYNFRREKQVTRNLSCVNLTVVEDLPKLKLNIQYPYIEEQTCLQKGIFNWISSLCSRLIRSPVDRLIAFILDCIYSRSFQPFGFHPRRLSLLPKSTLITFFDFYLFPSAIFKFFSSSPI